jgi:SAM-dependent methyltransferase
MKERSYETELMDDPDLPEHVLDLVLRDLTFTHRLLGNIAALVGMIGRSQSPVQRVLDIGCGGGHLMAEIRKHTGADVIGVDLRPPRVHVPGVHIVQADAVRDTLPSADVAVAVCMVHHLTDDAFSQMVHNVGRSCRRFIVLDLVRHQVPWWLFRIFVAPLLHPINRHDGLVSIRRAFTPQEMHELLRNTLSGTSATFDVRVAPLYARQIADIRY